MSLRGATRVTCLVALGALSLSLMVGCRRARARPVETADEPAAPNAATSSLEKFPADDAVPGSKSFPLRTITTANLLGRTKEGAPNTWPFTLIDARTRVEYENEHIAGAINVPAEKVEKELGSVVQDRSREVVFYCNGPACTKSHKAGRSAIASGFPKAVVYDEGLPAWKTASLPIEGDPLPKIELAKLAPTAVRDALKTKSVQLVDIRPRDEFLVFRVAGSINIPLDDLQARLKHEAKPNSAIVIADYTGHQQEVAARLLTKLGYTNVKGIDGGLRGWQGANLPVDKGLESVAAVPVAAEAKAKTAPPAPATPAKP